jgi:hypothetical protein
MDGAQVSVLEKTNEVRLGSLLQSKNSLTLEAKVSLELLSDLTHKTLERKLADQKIGRLLVATDLTKSNGTWAETMRLLDTTGSWGGLTCCLVGELLTWGLATSRLTCGLLWKGGGGGRERERERERKKGREGI